MIRVLLLMVFALPAFAQTEPKKEAPKGPPPTKANVAYGEHPRQVMDFYQAKSETPTPVVVYIHGGGWNNGSKDNYGATAAKYNAAGVSVVAINYRMVPEATTKKIEPPVLWPLSDAARAVQFVRSKAKEWNIDPKRLGCTGGSAGACSSLWLAYHDDLADPKSADPVARESTRLMCAAVSGAQTSLDPKVVKEWIANAKYGGHAFAVEGKYSDVKQFSAFLEKRDDLMKWIKEYSPAEHVTTDDPPVFMEYAAQDKPPVKGEAQKDPTHSANYGLLLMEHQKEGKPEMILTYPGKPHEKYKNSMEYLVDRLKK